MKIFLLLNDIRSVYNVGAIFRTADAVGISKIFLTGITPTPVDRFGKSRRDFAKSALGSERNIDWEYVKSPLLILKELKSKNFGIVAVEQTKNSVDYKKFKPRSDTLVVFGNEVSGVPKKILKAVDVVTEIPMRGRKESLNVSVSAGIVLFRWFDQ